MKTITTDEIKQIYEASGKKISRTGKCVGVCGEEKPEKPENKQKNSLPLLPPLSALLLSFFFLV